MKNIALVLLLSLLASAQEVELSAESLLQEKLDGVDVPYRAKAMRELAQFQVDPAQQDSVHLNSKGILCWGCGSPPPPISVGAASVEFEEASEPGMASADFNPTGSLDISPWPESMKFHSMPGSTNIIYLDFDGETITGTEWNNYSGQPATIEATAFSMPTSKQFSGNAGDSNASQLNISEQISIRNIWQRISEDFAPFDVDVTTERPSAAAFATNRVAHVLFTDTTDANASANPFSGALGAGFGGFGDAGFGALKSPSVFIYCDNNNYQPRKLGDTGSHELGHNFNLNHDGPFSGPNYYNGHGGTGSDPTSWAPIMGDPGSPRSLTQWSKGDYTGHVNEFGGTQDDIAIIQGLLGLRQDDHGNTDASASPLILQDSTDVNYSSFNTDLCAVLPVANHPGNRGIIGADGDVDVMTFYTGAGTVSFHVWPWRSDFQTRGGNLDVSIQLVDDQGGIVTTANPVDETDASLSAVVAEGRYFLRITNSGALDPFGGSPTGYTSYGSLGQYFIEGSIIAPTGLDPYQAWVERHYLPTGADGVDDNADGDRFSNWFEFAFGSTPARNDGGPLEWEGSGGELTPGSPILLPPNPSYAARFMRRKDHGQAGGLSYAWQFSSDLTDWESSADAPAWFATPTPLQDDASGEYELVEVPYPALLDNGQPPKFFRLGLDAVPGP